MVNVLLRKIHVNDDFGVSKVVISTQKKEHGKPPKEFEDVKL